MIVMLMNFERLPEFEKDLKQLSKKYRTLQDDLLVIQQVLDVSPDERPPFSFRIDGLGIESCIIKVKKMACRSLKGRGVKTGLRLVYAYFEYEERIVFIELFHKSDKGLQNNERILKYFS